MTDIEKTKEMLLKQMCEIIPKVEHSVSFSVDLQRSEEVKNLAIAYRMLSIKEEK